MEKDVSYSEQWNIRIQFAAKLDSWLDMAWHPLQAVTNEGNGTVLAGRVEDVSAIYGLLHRLRDSGLPWERLAVCRLDTENWWDSRTE